MAIPRPIFCLTLLVVLSTAGVFAQDDDSKGSELRMQLTFSDLGASSLPFDVEGWAEWLCARDLPNPPIMAGPPLMTCQLTVTNTPRIYAESMESLRPAGSFAFAPLRATGTDERVIFTPVVTSCGTWDVALSLDEAGQPDSPLLLDPDSDDAGRGHFASVLKMNTHLHLTHQTTGRTADRALVLGLGLAGSWAFEAAGEASIDPPIEDDGADFLVWNDCVEDDPEPCVPVICNWNLRAPGIRVSHPVF